MDIAVEKLTLVKRTFLTMHLSLDIARAEVLNKQTLECNGTMLGGAREYYKHYYKEAYGNHKCWLETAEEIADIEYKSHSYKHTHNHC